MLTAPSENASSFSHRLLFKVCPNLDFVSAKVELFPHGLTVVLCYRHGTIDRHAECRRPVIGRAEVDLKLCKRIEAAPIFIKGYTPDTV